MSDNKFCIAQLPNGSRVVCPITEILLADGDGQWTITATEQQIIRAKKGVTETLRMKLKTQDGTQYPAITVLRFGEDSDDLKQFLRNNETGRGKRLPNPKRRNFTPKLVKSISKIKKKKLVVRDEPIKTGKIVKKLQLAKEKAVLESDALIFHHSKPAAQSSLLQKKNEGSDESAASKTNIENKKTRFSEKALKMTSNKSVVKNGKKKKPPQQEPLRDEKSLIGRKTAIESDDSLSSSELHQGQESQRKITVVAQIHRENEIEPYQGLQKSDGQLLQTDDEMSLQLKLDMREEKIATLEAIRSSSEKELAQCKAELLRTRNERDALQKKLNQDGGPENSITRKDLDEALETARKQLLLDLDKNVAVANPIFNDYTENIDISTDDAHGSGSTLIRPDTDGTVQVAPGIRMNTTDYIKAADAATMRKRANCVISGFWPLETRLRLTLKEDHSANERLITSKEIKQILYICNQLQNHKVLKNTKNMDPCRKLRLWISAKLKSERYRDMNSR